MFNYTIFVINSAMFNLDYSAIFNDTVDILIIFFISISMISKTTLYKDLILQVTFKNKFIVSQKYTNTSALFAIFIPTFSIFINNASSGNFFFNSLITQFTYKNPSPIN